jgi:hypothetical protein
MEDTYKDLAQLFFKGEITPEEYVERYNKLIEKEAEQHAEPFEEHEHI